VRTAAILPVKRFAAAKQRLGRSVTQELRLRLVPAMVADVLEALALTPGLELTIVVSGQEDVARAARGHGAEVLEDRADRGQSDAVSRGCAHALALGIERVLCVPGDCPALDPVELGALLATAAPGELVIVPDRHGSGTNGLLLAPPDAIEPSFGPDSFERHRRAASAAGFAVRVERPRSLLLDIDTGADLDELRRRLAGAGGGGSRTRQVLESEAPGEGRPATPAPPATR
jgi:2-phospho-L-lactate/phosphoenolpyruvate guanylyltransferase